MTTHEILEVYYHPSSAAREACHSLVARSNGILDLSTSAKGAYHDKALNNPVIQNEIRQNDKAQND